MWDHRSTLHNTTHTHIHIHIYFTLAICAFATRTYFNNVIGLGMYVVQGVRLGQSGRTSQARRHWPSWKIAFPSLLQSPLASGWWIAVTFPKPRKWPRNYTRTRLMYRSWPSTYSSIMWRDARFKLLDTGASQERHVSSNAPYFFPTDSWCSRNEWIQWKRDYACSVWRTIKKTRL